MNLDKLIQKQLAEFDELFGDKALIGTPEEIKQWHKDSIKEIVEAVLDEAIGEAKEYCTPDKLINEPQHKEIDGYNSKRQDLIDLKNKLTK